MSAETQSEPKLEIAHVLTMDVVEYSTLFITEQREVMSELNRIVRNTAPFRASEAAGTLIRLPTGDGMALVFLTHPEAPLECAMEISAAIKSRPQIRLRMGIHSGPVSQTVDVNDQSNLAGAGLDIAQRVVDCGDAGHILLSKHVADDLVSYQRWNRHLHDLGECEVKHGRALALVNFYTEELGNPARPKRLTNRRTSAGMGAGRFWNYRNALLLSLGILALLGALFLFSTRSTRRARTVLPVAPEKSVAVLPFKNLSDEKKNTYFTDGMQDEILTALARIGDLKVISRTSVMQYQDTTERDLPAIARSLHVAHVLEGSVQRFENRVRVNAQLIDARTEAHLWANTYDRDLADVFAIQSEIAHAIADQLRAKLSPAEQAAIEQPPTTDLAAYDLYIRAKVLLNGTTFSSSAKDKYLEAVQLLDTAIARDPSFFLAFTQLAWAHSRIYFFGYDHTAERLALAESAVKTALRLRPDAGEAHLALAQHLYRGYMDYIGARRELALARKVLPNDPLVYELTGYMDRRQGDWEGSTVNLERALDYDPRNLLILQQISISYQKLRRFSEQAAVLDRALELDPRDVDTRITRAEVDLDWRADTRPLTGMIATVLQENPNAAGDIAESWFFAALYERDSASIARALAAFQGYGINIDGITFPRAFCEGLSAMVRDDRDGARSAFETARIDLARVVREQPDYAQALCVLGLVDAGLGYKDEALREGRRAVELLPVAHDSVNGAHMITFLAAIYSWTGEKAMALEQLHIAAEMPGDLSYGQLKLSPFWDPLRGDPGFEDILAKLAPKERAAK